MQEIFKFDQSGLADDGAVIGKFVATGIRPKFEQKLRNRGILLSPNIFEPEEYRA